MIAAGRHATTASASERFVFADVIRALAPFLVVYSDFSLVWMPARNSAPSWMAPLDLVERYALRLEGQGVGQFAVALFFLVSGFVVTANGLTGSARRFAVKRLARVYPVLIVAVLLAALAVTAGVHPLWNDPPSPTTPGAILANLSLANFVLGPGPGLVGVAWTLVVEMLFYLLFLALRPLFRWRLWYAVCVELTVVAVVLAAARAFGSAFLLFAGFASFLPVIVLGQLLWAVRARRVGTRAGLALGAAAWLLCVGADRLALAHHDVSSGLALAYAVLVFGGGLVVESRLRPRQWITFLAERGYAVYLLHGVVLFPVIDLTGRWLPFRAALPIGLLITAGAVEAVYRLVDRPARRLVAPSRALPPTLVGETGNDRPPRGEQTLDTSVLIRQEASHEATCGNVGGGRVGGGGGYRGADGGGVDRGHLV